MSNPDRSATSAQASTSQHLVVRRYHNPGPWPWLFGLLGLLDLALVQGTVVLDRVEADISARTRATLSSLSATDVNISVRGRDVTLRGQAPAGVEPAVLERAVAGLDGVRRVRTYWRVTPTP